MIVILGNQRLYSVPLGERPLSVGRGRGCDIVLPLPEISRLHAVLTRRGNEVLVEDRSRNGIIVDGRRVNSAELPARGAVGVLAYSLRIALDEDDNPPSSAEQTLTETIGGRSADDGFCEMLGTSTPMKDLYERIRAAARSPDPVLILGETGTGKELVARALHSLGASWSGPWVAVNCAAISPELVESELFGHERGAFTGASTRRTGAFEAADGGAIFLDEIGEMPLGVQPKLLRVLDTLEVARVGGERPVRVQVRVLAATNRELAADAAAGRFRADLYHRLCAIPLHVPPLRERGDDAIRLAQYFLAERAAFPPELSTGAVDELRRHGWPGNVRELRNVMRRLAGVYERRTIPAEALRAAIDAGRSAAAGATGEGSSPGSKRARAPEVPGASLREVERLAVVRALEDSGGNRREAARRLGIAPSTLYEKMRRFGIASS